MPYTPLGKGALVNSGGVLLGREPLSSANVADTLPTRATTLKLPVVPPAMSRGDVAMPVADVIACAVRSPSIVADGPALGAVNVTTAPGTGWFAASRTRTERRAA